MTTRSLKIHRTFIRPGTRQQLEIPLVRLPTGTWTSLPLIVVHGKEEGPRRDPAGDDRAWHAWQKQDDRK